MGQDLRDRPEALVQRVRLALARLALLELAPQDQLAIPEREDLLELLAQAALQALKVLPDQQVLELLDPLVRWQLALAGPRACRVLQARLALMDKLDPRALQGAPASQARQALPALSGRAAQQEQVPPALRATPARLV